MPRNTFPVPTPIPGAGVGPAPLSPNYIFDQSVPVGALGTPTPPPIPFPSATPSPTPTPFYDTPYGQELSAARAQALNAYVKPPPMPIDPGQNPISPSGVINPAFIRAGYGGGSLSVGGNDIYGFGLGNTGFYGGLPSSAGIGGSPTVQTPTSGGYYSGIPIYSDPFSASVYDASGSYQPMGSGQSYTGSTYTGIPIYDNPFTASVYDASGGYQPLGSGGSAVYEATGPAVYEDTGGYDSMYAPIDYSLGSPGDIYATMSEGDQPFTDPGSIDPFAGATASGDFGSGVADPFAGATAGGSFGSGAGGGGTGGGSGGGAAAPMPTSSYYPSYQPGVYQDQTTGQLYQVTADPITGGSIITSAGSMGLGSAGTGVGAPGGAFSTPGSGPQFSSGPGSGYPGYLSTGGRAGGIPMGYFVGSAMGAQTGGYMPVGAGGMGERSRTFGELQMPGSVSDFYDLKALHGHEVYPGGPYTPKGGKTSGIKAPSSGTLARAYSGTGSPRAR